MSERRSLSPDSIADRPPSGRPVWKIRRRVVSLTTMQKGLLDTAPKDVHGDILKQTVNLDGVFVTKVTFGVGAKWSRDLKPYAVTESCLLPHVAYVLSGTIAIRMDDGSEQIFRAGEVMMLPPGHD